MTDELENTGLQDEGFDDTSSEPELVDAVEGAPETADDVSLAEDDEPAGDHAPDDDGAVPLAEDDSSETDEASDANDEPPVEEDAPPTEGPAHDGDTVPSEVVVVAQTLELPVAVEAPTEDEGPELEDPRLSDVGHTLGGWLRGRFRALGSLLTRHRIIGILLVLACVGGLAAGVLAGFNAMKTPPDDRIEADARSLLKAPEYSPSPYAVDDALVLQDIRIIGKHPGQGDDGSCVVDVEAVFAKEGMESRADGQLMYRRDGDEWTCTSGRTGNASHRATGGVYTQGVTDHVSELLRAADTREGGDGLATLYSDAKVDLVSEQFNEEEQSDDVALHCASTGTFVNYECDLSAHFRFVPASGAWELAEAEVDEGAYDLGLGPLVGTWHGNFTSQQSSSQKCLAAGSKGLTVQITSAVMTDDGGARIEGTFSGVAHMHGELTADAQESAGDQQLDNVPFSGNLAKEVSGTQDDLFAILTGAKQSNDTAGLIFDCTTQDLASGKATLTLTFGHADDPDAATATLASNFAYEDTVLLVVPVQKQASFTDSYVLKKD